LNYYPLFFSDAPNNQGNAYFNPNIDTCYVALADYELTSIGARTRYVTPSNKPSHDQSWNLEHLGTATGRLSRPVDLSKFPAVKFMAVDAAFLKKSHIEPWEEFFAHIPSLESFFFFDNGNSILSSKSTRVENWKSAKIGGWNHPSVFRCKFLPG